KCSQKLVGRHILKTSRSARIGLFCGALSLCISDLSTSPFPVGEANLSSPETGGFGGFGVSEASSSPETPETPGFWEVRQDVRKCNTERSRPCSIRRLVNRSFSGQISRPRSLSRLYNWR